MTKPDLIRVYPTLPEGSFLAGVGSDGAEVPAATAAAWIAAGLATKTPPKPDDEPAQPDKE